MIWAMLRITDEISIDEAELEERFIRSSGPGGQNVNKVSTAVELRFDVAGSTTLPPPVKVRLGRVAGRRLTDEGVLVLRADRFRTQERNREDARERLIALIREATVVPKRRIKTRPSRGSQERRLESKQRRGKTKRRRQERPSFD